MRTYRILGAHGAMLKTLSRKLRMKEGRAAVHDDLLLIISYVLVEAVNADRTEGISKSTSC